MRLDDIIQTIWPAGDGPIIMGPDAGGGQYLADFQSTLQKAKRTSLLRAFTYHSYSSADIAGQRVAAENGGRGEFGLRNASVLDWYGASGFNKDSAMVATGFNTPSSQTQTWIGEMASCAGGGKPGVSDRYASLFFYVDSLSATAAANFSGFLRQDLTGASYGLVQGCARTSGGAGTSEPAASWSAYNKRYGWVPAVGTCTPNPDYWGGLLWHHLMGSKGQRVMNVSAAFATGADVTLRAYGHCGNPSASGDLSLVLINLLNTSNTVGLPGAVGARTDYVLTPGEPAGGWAVDHHGQRDETKTDVVLLNGRVLSLDGAAVPAISGAAGSGGRVALPPLAIAFVVVHKSTSCASLKTDDSHGHVRYCTAREDRAFVAGGYAGLVLADIPAPEGNLPALKADDDAQHLVAACSVCEHGGKADGTHDNGPVVQAALAGCSSVVIPAAGCGGSASAASPAVFLVGPVVIPSDRTLIILGTVTTLPPERWPLVQNKSLADCSIGSCMYKHLFNAAAARNITVTGNGMIEGGGPAWWHLWAEDKLMAHRPMLINLGGDDLTLSGISIHNPPMEGAGLSSGSRHRVHGYRASVDLPGLQAIRGNAKQRIRRTYESANAACLMLSDASDVHVSNVHLVCGDDNIAMNANSRELKDVVIEDSYFGWGHGCSIGSMTEAGLSNITVRNSVWNGTNSGIKVKSYIGGGGRVDYSAQNVSLHSVELPIDLEQHYGGAALPCMPHCNVSHRPVFKVEIIGMHADDIPKADLGPYLNGTSDSNSIMLTVSDSTFTTADGKPALWRCENAHVTANRVVPMPGKCPRKVGALTSREKNDDAQPQLSRQTREWWRWVLVRLYQSSTFIPDGDDGARQAFVDKWRPDLFDWGGDQRWQVREWARLHGIAHAAAGDIEYEEAQFANHSYVNLTWGVEGGLALNLAGNQAGFASGGLSPYMTHAAPKWHATVTQPHIRHARAHVGEANSQDNCDVMSFAHGGPDMGWGPWEEQLFANSSFGATLGLATNFSVREYIRTPPVKAFGTDPIVRAFAEWTYLVWRDAWRDLAESSRHAARVAGVPEPAVYGNSANQAMAIMESAWQSLKWIEIGWGGPSALTFKLSQAQLRGAGNYTGVWRVAGLRTGQAERYGSRGVKAYLAEAMSNDGNEELLEGLEKTETAFGGGWAHVPECFASAQLASTHRSVFIDRTRIADGAIIYCLACVMWRQTGVLSPGADVHSNAVAYVSGSLETHQVLYEIALLGHPRLFDRPEGLTRLKPPSEGGYSWIILPVVDAMSDSDVALIESYVRGGGRAVIIDGPANYATGIHTEDLAPRCNMTGCGLVGQLQKDPGAGHVTVVNSTVLTNFPVLHAEIAAAIKGSTGAVSVTGLSELQSFNAWLHGRGPMVSMHVVNNNFSSPLATMPPFQLTVRTKELAAAVKPVARLFSIDFPNESTGRVLPITRSADGKALIVSVAPPSALAPDTPTCNYTVDTPPRKGLIRTAGPNFMGVTTAATVEACAALCCKTDGCALWSLDTPWYGSWSSCVKGMPCCALAHGPLGGYRAYSGGMNVTTGIFLGRRTAAVDTHAIVVVASSEAELATRVVAAEARMWLQKAVLANSSHGVRLLSSDGAAKPSATPVLLAADRALSLIQGEEARPFVDDPGFRSNLTTSISQLQALMNVTRLDVSNNEASRRLDHLQMCSKPGSCLAAVNFVARNASAVPWFTAVGADTLYTAAGKLGWVNTNDKLRDARVAFETKMPDELHRSGVFNSYRSTLRLDVDLGTVDAPSSLLLTTISGFDDLGSPDTAAGMGVFGGQKVVPAAGMCGGTPCGGREMKAWMGIASTAVNVVVRPANQTAGNAAAPMAMAEQPCMLGATGRLNGYFLTRACRINVSAAVKVSQKLQIDLVLAPQNGLTGCWAGLCGKMSFAWLMNGLVLQRPTAALGLRAKASLAHADAFAASAVREWHWVGPFGDDHGNGMANKHEIEISMFKTAAPPFLNETYTGKTGDTVGWRPYEESAAATAPHLPLSALLPTRELNTESIAFAMAHVNCAVATGCERQLRVSMSDRGRVWLLSATGVHQPQEVAVDNLLHGLTPDEQTVTITLSQGASVLLVKTLSTFAADTIAVNGSRAPGWGSHGP
jgi:hypothetical protein